jgi:hypothetical protein
MGEWLNLAERLASNQEVAGSTPVSLTLNLICLSGVAVTRHLAKVALRVRPPSKTRNNLIMCS